MRATEIVDHINNHMGEVYAVGREEGYRDTDGYPIKTGVDIVFGDMVVHLTDFGEDHWSVDKKPLNHP